MCAKAAYYALLVFWGVFGGVQYCVASGDEAANGGMRSDKMPVSSPVLEHGVLPADTPAGYVGFCLRFPGQCAESSHDPQQIELTEGAWTVLNSVNKTVNHLISPMSDIAHYGVREFWTIPRDGFGDCEDYALAKRAVLTSVGLPRSALRIAIVKTSAGEGHAVLTVVTDHGDFVLDNLTDTIHGWKAADYQWLEWQNPVSKSGWVSLGHPETTIRTASAPAGK